jgi:4-hydroxy-3-polyprenylbenzoate decarboxylase
MGKITYNDLREWLAQADELGELKYVNGASWEEDAGMLAEMLAHSDEGPAVIMDKFPGFPEGFRILINANGARRRIALTVGEDPDIGKMDLVHAVTKQLDGLETIPPEVVETGPVMENVLKGDDIDVYKFPVPKWHLEDGGRYIGTGSYDITRDPDDGTVNLGTYRVMIQDKDKVGFYISPGKDGRIHRDKYFAAGQPCPVAMVIGGDPLLFMAGSLEVKKGICEYDWAGGMAGKPYRVIIDPITGLPIPADAEIVLVGFSYPDKTMEEGPFGEWTGYYASGHRAEPYLQIEAIYHRNNPIILGTPPEKPPYEAHKYREYLRSGMLMDEVKKAGVVDVVGAWCHGVGGCRMLNVIQVKTRYAGHAMQAAHVACQCRVGAYIGRLTIVVDEDIDITDLGDVMWAVCTRADPATDLDIIKNAWGGPLDPRIHPDNKAEGNYYASRLIIDATRPFNWKDRFPVPIGPSPEYKWKTREKWGYLLKG